MTRHKHKLSTCPNCDHALDPHYDFCPSCGQENHDIRVPIGHLGYEFIEGITHFDTKLWNTLKYYFTRPGQMTKEYLDGKRARFVPAPRLYIFVSVLFFVVLNQLAHISADNLKSIFESKKDKIIINLESKKYILQISEAEYLLCLNREKGDSLLIANENPLSGDYISLKKAFHDSLVNRIQKKVKNRLSKALKELEEDWNDTTEQIDGVEFNFNEGETNSSFSTTRKSTKEEVISKNQKDSIEALKEIAKIDSMYNGEKCNDLKEYDTEGFFGDSYSKKEIDFMSSATNSQIDSIILSKDSTASLWFERGILKNSKDFSKGDLEKLFIKSIKALSFAMFIFMPLIALITFLFFRKRRKYYVEHLIFSLHIHTFLFIILGIMGAVYLYLYDDMPEWVWGVFFLSLAIYIIVSIKMVFENSWIKSTLKFFAISFIYITLLFMVIIGTLIAAGALL